jgi:hypothetical protein
MRQKSHTKIRPTHKIVPCLLVACEAAGRAATTTDEKRRSVVVGNTKQVPEETRLDLQVGAGDVNVVNGYNKVAVSKPEGEYGTAIRRNSV